MKNPVLVAKKLTEGRNSHWSKLAMTHLISMFPDLPQQSGYNKHLRKFAHLMQHVITHLATTSGEAHR